MRRRLTFSLLLALPLVALAAQRGAGRDRPLLDDATFAPSSAEVTTNMGQQGVNVGIKPGADAYPGVRLTPKGGSWDLSKYGHLDTEVANSGLDAVTVSLRVDNAGDWRDNPWNTETVTLGPGEAKTVRVVFGYSYGMKKGFKLDPSKVVGALVFTTKAEGPRAFRVRWLGAGGPAGETPPVAPDDARVKPEKGDLLAPGAVDFRTEGDALDLGGATVTDHHLQFRTGAGVARIVPKTGRWDLRDATQVRVTVQNMGRTDCTPRVRLETNGGDTAWVSLGRPLPSLGKAEIVVPFGHLVDLGRPETTVGIATDAVQAVALSTEGGGNLEVVAAKAESPAADVPAWLGKRPPVAGEWTKTLDDEFDGTRLDPTVWKTSGENYYDKVSHWSKEEVAVKDGLARLRYEKKSGFQNDDPKRDKTAYAAGYLDTFGLWKQRYGYFEARMRAPRAPGLWPAFWMMPDRGSKPGTPGWDRQTTANGGMEFDIMEGLTRWGPHRYNIAMHYDGYEKDHKSLGSDKVYVETDKEGFVTCGLLWTPGLAVYYCNGKEVLRWENPRVSSVPSMLMFTLPSGGWDNDAVNDVRLPADFAIDYVRVWQRKDLASGADGKRKDPQTS